MSRDVEDHRIHNNSQNLPFGEVVERHLSRRQILQGGLGLAALSIKEGKIYPLGLHLRHFKSCIPLMEDDVIVKERLPWN